LEQLMAQPACEKCAGPVVTNGAPCPWCRGEGVYPFKYIARLGRFGDPLRPVIHAMKYRGGWPLARRVAERMAEQTSVRKILEEADVLVPAPLHWMRQIARGYNQADVLARGLGRASGKKIKIIQAVRRVRRTVSQTAITSRTEREENVRDAFAAKLSRAVMGKRVVVVDDVMTTGATIQGVARALLELEPESICAVVVASGDPKGQDFQAI
jgi:ComF family protein